MIRYDILVKGLVDHGINLSTDPYEKVMNIPRYIEYKQMVINWTAFIRANPEYQYEHISRIQKVFIEALKYDNWERESVIKRKEYQEIRRLARSLPDMTVLTDSCISMKLFVKYGINFYSLRATKGGKLLRMLLRGIRKRKNY